MVLVQWQFYPLCWSEIEMFAALVPHVCYIEKHSNLHGTILSPIGASLQTYEIDLHFREIMVERK